MIIDKKKLIPEARWELKQAFDRTGVNTVDKLSLNNLIKIWQKQENRGQVLASGAISDEAWHCTYCNCICYYYLFNEAKLEIEEKLGYKLDDNYETTCETCLDALNNLGDIN